MNMSENKSNAESISSNTQKSVSGVKSKGKTLSADAEVFCPRSQNSPDQRTVNDVYNVPLGHTAFPAAISGATGVVDFQNVGYGHVAPNFNPVGVPFLMVSDVTSDTYQQHSEYDHRVQGQRNSARNASQPRANQKSFTRNRQFNQRYQLGDQKPTVVSSQSNQSHELQEQQQLVLGQKQWEPHGSHKKFHHHPQRKHGHHTREQQRAQMHQQQYQAGDQSRNGRCGQRYQQGNVTDQHPQQEQQHQLRESHQSPRSHQHRQNSDRRFNNQCGNTTQVKTRAAGAVVRSRDQGEAAMAAILAKVDNFSQKSRPKTSSQETVVNKPLNMVDCSSSKLAVSDTDSHDCSVNTERRRKQGARQVATDNDETQRGVLIEQLRGATYECMVCYDVVRCETAVWNCSSCYHVYHLYCIKKWARSPTAQVSELDGAWRCPSCQQVTSRVPNQYRCFCGKVRDPPYNHHETPHSCGEVCRKKRGDNCPHPCNILCHPGPCPPCQVMVKKSCRCHATKKSVLCSHTGVHTCSKVCNKRLNCGQHQCAGVCHSPPCAPCDVQVTQTCFCGASQRTVLCGSEESLYDSYTCGTPCAKELDCGNHKCTLVCHAGPCDSCALLPSVVTHCPCGKTALDEMCTEGAKRTSCLDSVPTCDKICGKPLNCGPEANRHSCKSLCHTGDCPPCQGDCTTPVTCRCEAVVKEFSCTEAVKFTVEQPFLCERRCHKKRHCGKHKCNQLCCVDEDHTCLQTCGRKLTCGLHKCEEPCHRGNCPPCWHVSFDELSCHCGAEILFPPIPCGTKPPECNRPCTRQHACKHPVQHNCHSEDQCPPCVVLTRKLCMGEHEMRNSVPCHLTNISCGMPCNKPLPCGQHVCKRTCHRGDCLQDGEACLQPCTKSRSDCGHPCGAPCHAGQECPMFPCKAEMTLKCKCGNRTGKAVCLMGAAPSQEFSRVTAISLASKMHDLQLGLSVDIGDLMKTSKPAAERKLECNEQCSIIERNRRVALALEIKNPDLSSKLGAPVYTQFLKDMAKRNPSLVASIEKALGNLVQTAQSSKQKSRSYAFAPMNRDQRQTVHELGEFYGCETQSYDNEPTRNVVATAYRDKCWMPSVSLTTAVQRERLPKAPPPIPHGLDESKVRAAVLAQNQCTDVLQPSDKEKGKLDAKKDYFDYFDMTD